MPWEWITYNVYQIVESAKDFPFQFAPYDREERRTNLILISAMVLGLAILLRPGKDKGVGLAAASAALLIGSWLFPSSLPAWGMALIALALVVVAVVTSTRWERRRKERNR